MILRKISDLNEILKKHKMWLKGISGGVRANLYGANLYGANLIGAITDNVKYNEATAFFALQCPESGSYRAYKKAKRLIVELEIPEDAKRSSATSRKCRASKAKVLGITYPDGTPAGAAFPAITTARLSMSQVKRLR